MKTQLAKSVAAFGIYMIIEGAILLLFPNELITFFGLLATEEVWIRVVGWVLIVLGYYYTNAARNDFGPFFTWTIQIRSLQFAVFIIFVLLQFVGPAILLFSGIEFLSGIWSLTLLKLGK